MIKEKIEMDKEIVQDDYICVHNEHTSFINIRRRELPNIDKLEAKVRELRATLKAQGVSLGRTNTLKTFKERKSEYITMVEDYNSKFDELVKGWEKKIEDGIYVGYRDDIFLREYLNPLKWSIDAMFYRDQLFSHILEIQKDVNEVENGLKEGVEYVEVYI